MDGPKYPHIVCDLDLDGPGGNIFAVIGRIRGEMKRARIDQREIDRFTAEVQHTHSYNEALRVCAKWVVMPA